MGELTEGGLAEAEGKQRCQFHFFKKTSLPQIYLLSPSRHFGSHLYECVQDISCTAGPSPVVPTAGWPGNVTLLRSGSGRLRLGRLGSGGKPPGRGIRPATTNNAVRLG